ncbi:MAG: hypothetical protein ABIN61_08875 [candidate division WOR-3 bacterium]
MKVRLIKFSWVCITILVLFFSFGQGNQTINKTTKNLKLILIFVDYSTISCSFCLDSFIALFNKLEKQKNEEGIVTGIVLSDNLEDENKVKIIEKQLRGFVKANNINFPLILDKTNIFKGLNLENTVIVIDVSSDIIKKFKFPLSKTQIKELIEGER